MIDAGGTIVSFASNETDFQSYDVTRGRVPLEEMATEAARLSKCDALEIVTSEISGRSTEMKESQLLELIRLVNFSLARSEIRGVVVVTGTNLIEEVAYYLELTQQFPKPVVVTGAMRQLNVVGFDGLANLVGALAVAHCPALTRYGTLVVMNGEIFSAREVYKSDGYMLNAFDGGSYGRVGRIFGREVQVRRLSFRATLDNDCWIYPFELQTLLDRGLADIEVVNTWLDAPGRTLSALGERVAGLVAAGVGPGALSEAQRRAVFALLDAGLIGVVASRTGGQGHIGPLDHDRLISAGALLPQKARILLSVAASVTSDVDRIKEWFRNIGNSFA